MFESLHLSSQTKCVEKVGPEAQDGAKTLLLFLNYQKEQDQTTLAAQLRRPLENLEAFKVTELIRKRRITYLNI